MLDWLSAQHLLTPIIVMLVLVGTLLGGALYLVLLERKISAWMQDRIGPNRLGPGGVFQPIADALKIFFKEDIIPAHVDKLFFVAAPGIAVATALMALAVVPIGPTMPPPHAVDVREPESLKNYQETYHSTPQIMIAPGTDVGVLFVLAVGSLNVYGVILGGWSSNNKYSMLGSLRSSAQIISYEIPMGTALLAVILYSGSMNLEKIIDAQVGRDGIGWNILFQPLTFLMFLIAVFAECSRLPFDLPEAEQELVGGYHTEYSSLKFVFFYLAEYIHMVTTSFLMSILFLGGWHFPGLSTIGGEGTVLNYVVKILILGAKVGGFITFFMLIRWTIPRFRYDQLMGLAWQTLIPLSLVSLVLVMIVRQNDWPPFVLLPLQLGLLVAVGALRLRRPRVPVVIRTGKHPALIT
ncbi:MAG TPA: NADH-quinone oxidoreductase subunit NuoH [Gemmataceae bacterium]|nr:NADH-quinone oxidoreductase subunit NuoH [Gemmataceae bacterium]